MAILEKVTQMKEQGLSESQIINLLREQGVSPKEINDALTQSKIKSSIGKNRNAFDDEYINMKPSITEKRQASNNQEQEIEEAEFQDYPAQNNEPPQEQEGQGYYEDYNQNYGYYPEYQQPSSSTTDIETINDIAEQIVEEKNAEIKKQVSEFKKFSDDTKLDLEKIFERLTKLENIFNELQIAILKRIGEYGTDIKNIADEMHATQDSFSKILNPLTDNIRELQKITGSTQNSNKDTTQKSESEGTRKKPGKEKPGFEEYLR